jgi:hypothetical protein
MKRILLAAALLAGVGAAPGYAATEVSVEDVGSVLNESLALPANDAPGSGIGFAQFFEFTLPTAETVTISMSDSAIGTAAIIGGVLSLNTQTSTGAGPLFIPAGMLIESSPVVDTAGGQEATVNPALLSAGAYFAEISGTSGPAAIHIAIDGTVTATAGVAAPEPSTWALMALGFAAMGFFGYRRNKLARFAF